MLLKEQGTLQTPVGMFSAQHASATVEPEQAKFYKQLLPLTKPGVGEQYAFKVDLDQCTGCKSCVSACHSLNGLDPHETWRDVGTIHGVDLRGASYTQTVTSACHHCADPACLNGCPVLAYEKDAATGIVRHLDDQCIGCQYCALKCPYDVPKYSKSLGIVRKCDMCHGRLAAGEAPACVQACPTEAISITIVNTLDTLNAARAGAEFLPAAPEAAYTAPTTQYVTQRSIPDAVEAADLYALEPEHGHFPLVLMLVLTQLSVGLYGASIIAAPLFEHSLRVAGFICMAIGLSASTSHLGRPLGAWRAFLGLRRSWLSREILTFGLFSGLAALTTFTGFVDFLPRSLAHYSAWATFIIGLLGVFTSVMIYHDTQRPYWAFPITALKFFGTTVGLSAAMYVFFAAIEGVLSLPALCFMLIGFCSKLVLELTMLGQAQADTMSPAKKTAMLLLYPLRRTTILRFAVCLFGMLCAALLWWSGAPLLISSVSFICLFAAELLERSLFFRAVAAPKMPGGVQ
ncbi:DmsC/YnfH family molybdoenzyme membrane anchor subunit [Coraliomargarita algicola]|uniref:DmsC/YnfH family molybdoenzyme membrane anchor subunit n=1 Tax=Coraliomargarita algicola TaxID=3092156 RepID=A0ABZ0RMT0_9BACT|nr:DmsC/YnfH family molybdoenzyme membrane anchor subunit [Coraliomargarita sp. J2-16]WPJ96519.1 DmsC/YnfH family molybdoenzyme membrane anchor subunit [Coraliomargarita sp. J2-16]